jgi:16S rRNA A1518/A1519 N6-dimethyltransferase RsmA/KsgA/DIM1 with predicted DNA glycosylase/AP lyase activity
LAFAGRRKRLSNALKSLNLDWQLVSVDPGLRADDVTIEKFLALAGAAGSTEVQSD